MHATRTHRLCIHSCKVKPYCCCYCSFFLSFASIFHQSVRRALGGGIHRASNKGMIKTKKLIFNLKYLTKQKHKYTTWLACKTATMILVRVATSTSNNKSNNISTYERPYNSEIIFKYIWVILCQRELWQTKKGNEWMESGANTLIERRKITRVNHQDQCATMIVIDYAS